MKRTIANATNYLALIVDDEADILELLELTLLKMGLQVERASTVKAALQKVQEQEFDLCLTDMRLPDGEGLEIVRYIGANCPNLPVAVITAHGSTENAVAALKAGAFDYLSKPVALDQLRAVVKSALKLPSAVEPSTPEGYVLLGQSAAIQQVSDLIEKLARSQAPVYITGESGSGKELAARLIHEKSARREKAFVPVNCGAIPENLMESEFFGYRKGAFTGADQDRDGFFQAASGGTLFLDEVADLPLTMQVKLLRAIQEKKVRKVGATQEDPVDVRIISATHQKLADCVTSGNFRQDLYYRLNVIELKMPSLREMSDDVPLIAGNILARLSRQADGAAPELAPDAVEALQRYDFPGNVRELENILERALALCGSTQIHKDDLYLTDTVADDDPAHHEPGGKWPLPDYLDRVEKEALQEALEKTRYNKTAAAKLLGITFRALQIPSGAAGDRLKTVSQLCPCAAPFGHAQIIAIIGCRVYVNVDRRRHLDGLVKQVLDAGAQGQATVTRVKRCGGQIHRVVARQLIAQIAHFAVTRADMAQAQIQGELARRTPFHAQIEQTARRPRGWLASMMIFGSDQGQIAVDLYCLVQPALKLEFQPPAG